MGFITARSEIRHDLINRDVAGDGGCGCPVDSAASVVCSVCFDAGVENGKRSWAKLQCHHLFHRDCVGSAFNSKGSMQCPNCHKTEKGRCLYAKGSGEYPEISMVDFSRDEDIYNMNYSEALLESLWSLPSAQVHGSSFLNLLLNAPDLVLNEFGGRNAFHISNNWNGNHSSIINADQARSSMP